MSAECWSKPVVLGVSFVLFAGIFGSSRAQEFAPNAPIASDISAATAGAFSGEGTGNGQVGAGDAWVSAHVFNGFTLGIVFGDGQGDGTTRLYTTEITNNTVHELVYTGSWTNSSNISLPFYSEGALLVGDGRGNGSKHVYAAEFNFTGNAREFTWNGASWSDVNLGNAGQQLIGADQGNTHGDSSAHLYFSTGSAPPNNVTFETNFNGTSFTLAPIPSPLAGTADSTFGIAVGAGRNDALLRIYQAVFDAAPFVFYLYEFSWNGSGWDALPVATIGSGPASQVMAVAVGDGRNEGANRVYVVVRGSAVREFTYDYCSGWTQTADIPIGSELFSLSIGDGQNDGTNRLYIAQLNPSRLLEATFDGTQWQTEVVGTLSQGIFRVRVGDARGDGVNRVYSSGIGGIYEFTHQ
jgi:hypothetical protein